MKFPRTPRPLPVGLPHVHGQFDAIDLAAWAIRDLYDALFARARGAGKPGDDLYRVLLLQSNLPRAEAEMAYRGTTETLFKTRAITRKIAARADIELRVDYSMPDLLGLPLCRLPVFLGSGEPESEWDVVNEVRNQLDGLYQDASDRQDCIEIALLWASLPRAEAEIEFCGATATLDRIREVAEAIAQRLGVKLLDLEAEARGIPAPAVRRRHRQLVAA